MRFRCAECDTRMIWCWCMGNWIWKLMKSVAAIYLTLVPTRITNQTKYPYQREQLACWTWPEDTERKEKKKKEREEILLCSLDLLLFQSAICDLKSCMKLKYQENHIFIYPHNLFPTLCCFCFYLEFYVHMIRTYTFVLLLYCFVHFPNIIRFFNQNLAINVQSISLSNWLCFFLFQSYTCTCKVTWSCLYLFPVFIYKAWYIQMDSDWGKCARFV